MSGRVTVLTPIVGGEAVELGRHLFRKQCLPVDATLNYKGRKLHFSRDYLNRLVESFKGKAFDAVPLQLADADNRHTNAPERAAGEVIGLEAAADGLYATVSLTDKGADLVREHPNLGVSARIVEQFERGDGKAFPVALQHVLATWDPRVTGMKPWQAVECSNETTEVLDLSALTFAFDYNRGGNLPSPQLSVLDGGKTEGAKVAKLTDLTEEKVAELLALLETKKAEDAKTDTVVEQGEPEKQGTPPVEPENHDDGELSEEELAAIAAAVDEPVEVAASNDNTAVELANQQAVELAELRAETDRLRAERDTERFLKERDDLAKNFGIPPRITDLARPILEGSNRTVDLSNGPVDAGQIMRTVFQELGRTFKALDLSAQQGSPMDAPDDATAEEAARTKVAEEYIKSVIKS